MEIKERKVAALDGACPMPILPLLLQKAFRGGRRLFYTHPCGGRPPKQEQATFRLLFLQQSCSRQRGSATRRQGLLLARLLEACPFANGLRCGFACASRVIPFAELVKEGLYLPLNGIVELVKLL